MEREAVDPDTLNVATAASTQGQDAYRGVDAWDVTQLKPGTRLAQLDYYRENGSDATAGQYFTTEAEMMKHYDPETGMIDARALSERLQIMAYRGSPEDNFEYSPLVTVYEVTDNMDVATSYIRSNPTLGQGGAVQYFSPEAESGLIAGEGPEGQAVGFVKPVAQFQTTNREPSLPVYKDLDALLDGKTSLDVGRAEIVELAGSTVSDAHTGHKARLAESSQPDVLNYVTGMDQREDFAQQARDVLDAAELNQDWSAVADLKMPKTPAYPGEMKIAAAMIEDVGQRNEAERLVGAIDTIKASRGMDDPSVHDARSAHDPNRSDISQARKPDPRNQDAQRDRGFELND